jgi:hypothetical protein
MLSVLHCYGEIFRGPRKFSAASILNCLINKKIFTTEARDVRKNPQRLTVVVYI